MSNIIKFEEVDLATKMFGAPKSLLGAVELPPMSRWEILYLKIKTWLWWRRHGKLSRRLQQMLTPPNRRWYSFDDARQK